MKRQSHTPRLQQILEAIWYQNHLTAHLGKYLLSPLSLLFCIVAQLKKRIDTSKAPLLPVPIIVVGNISIGGTGKTPLVIYLARLLQQSGYKPCIITRGYKGTASQWPVQVDNQVDTTVCGDEAKLMSLVSNIPVVAGPDRVTDIAFAVEQTQANIIISDDGLQHYKMQRDIEIAVIDAQRGLGNGFCLPAGPLRETKSRLRSCDFIIHNGSDRNNAAHEYSMDLQGEYLTNLATKEVKHISEFTDIQVITGIGNPQRFINTLKNMGVNIVAESLFADHHQFSKDDFLTDLNFPIIMTQKDAVKCFNIPLDNAWYLPVSAKLDKSFEDDFLRKVVEIRPAS